LSDLVSRKEEIHVLLDSGKGRLKAFVGIKDSMLFFRFLLSLKNKNTRRAYFNDLLDFFEFLKRHKKCTYKDVKRSDIDHFSEVLTRHGVGESRPSGDSTVKRKITAVSKFYRFLIEEEILQSNPCQYVKRPKIPLEVKTQSLEVDEVKKILRIPNISSLTGLMHKALMTLMFTTGMRVGELISLKIGDFNKESGTLIVRANKSNKRLIKNLPKNLAELINLYLDKCELTDFLVDQELPLFRKSISKNPEQVTAPLTQQAVFSIFKTYGKKAGVDKDIKPHTGRVFYITEGLRTVSVGEMARDVGHSTNIMTNEYDKRRENRSLDIAENLGI
jgi:integrase/recombinase XerD